MTPKVLEELCPEKVCSDFLVSICQKPKRGINIKNLGITPPALPDTPPKGPPDPANSLCLGPLGPSKYRKKAYIKNFEEGGSWGAQNSLCWVSSRSFCRSPRKRPKISKNTHCRTFFQGKTSGLIQLVLTVLVFWCPMLLVPRHPASSRSVRLCPWATFCFMAAGMFARICYPQLPYHTCKPGTLSTNFCSTSGHTPILSISKLFRQPPSMAQKPVIARQHTKMFGGNVLTCSSSFLPTVELCWLDALTHRCKQKSVKCKQTNSNCK